MARVSINIVTWNAMRFLPEALESIEKQTFGDFNIIIVDNGSTDGTVQYIREYYPQITLIRNVKNLGFAHGHNQAMRLAIAKWPAEELDNRFVLVTNQDILLKEDFLENLIAEAEKQKQAGSFGGKLYKAFFSQGEDGFEETIKSDILDSTGLLVYKSRRVVDRGAGETDQKQYDEARDIFGVSGAIPMYRASALQSVRFRDEFFDDDFFCYKEDIDLAWRLRLAGWHSRYVPEAMAHHYRGAYSPEKSSWLKTVMARRKRSHLVNFRSFVNHYFVLIKNEYFSNLLVHLPWFVLYELKKNIYTFFFEPKTYWQGKVHVIKNLSLMMKKRKFNFSKARVGAKEMRNWIG